MERAEWLKHEREKAEKLYNLGAPQADIGGYQSEMHLEFLKKFLERIPPQSKLLSAACGAGQYDGFLLEAGHRVTGIDQARRLLARASEFFPNIRYEKIGLQEMDFQEEFDGITCIDALEHICPEDWPGVMRGFQEALKPGGVLYFTTMFSEEDQLTISYERAKALGLPVVYGEGIHHVEEDYEMAVMAGEKPDADDFRLYDYSPPLEQVRTWISQAGLIVEEDVTGNEERYAKLVWKYEHFIIRKK